MIAFAKRRLIGASTATVIIVLLFAVNSALRNRLIDTSIFTGICLLLMVTFLLALNWRKRLPFLPLLRTSTWLQIHIYVGWTAIAMFFVHTNFRGFNGAFEIILATLFLTVAFSGVVGLWISRMIPKKLTQNGGNVSYEQIPKMRRLLKMEAEKIATDSIESTKKSTIADFYVDRIEVFFIGSRRFFWNHLFGSQKHIQPLLTRMKAMHRYLNDQEIEIMDQLEKIVCRYDQLNYQHSLLSILKCWLFIHIPLSYSLFIFGVVHGVIAYRFLGA